MFTIIMFILGMAITFCISLFFVSNFNNWRYKDIKKLMLICKEQQKQIERLEKRKLHPSLN